MNNAQDEAIAGHSTSTKTTKGEREIQSKSMVAMKCGVELLRVYYRIPGIHQIRTVTPSQTSARNKY